MILSHMALFVIQGLKFKHFNDIFVKKRKESFPNITVS